MITVIVGNRTIQSNRKKGHSRLLNSILKSLPPTCNAILIVAQVEKCRMKKAKCEPKTFRGPSHSKRPRDHGAPLQGLVFVLRK